MQIVDSSRKKMNSPENDLFPQLVVVLVLFEMKLEDSPAFCTLTKALHAASSAVKLVVYDNSAEAGTWNSNPKWDIIYVHDPLNPGVSKAYNQAREYARPNKKKWLLLCDQDTVFPVNIFGQYTLAIAGNSSKHIFIPTLVDVHGVISPFVFSNGRGIRQKKLNPGNYLLKKLKFINSGTLVDGELYDQAGGYDERYPLDFSDLAFQRRLLLHVQEFNLVDATCTQTLSVSQIKPIPSVLGRFKIYSRAAALFDGPLSWVRFNLLIRAIKLTVQFRSLRFLQTGLTIFFSEKYS
jgi:rhamnosyltransferase